MQPKCKKFQQFFAPRSTMKSFIPSANCIERPLMRISEFFIFYFGLSRSKQAINKNAENFLNEMNVDRDCLKNFTLNFSSL